MKDDVDALQDAINALRSFTEDGIDKFSMSSVAQSHFLSLWSSIRKHKKTLLDIKAVVQRWRISVGGNEMEPSLMDLFKAKDDLKRSWKRLKTSSKVLFSGVLEGIQ